MNYGSTAEVRYSVNFGKLSSLVFKDFNISTIETVTELLNRGYAGEKIRIIEKKSEPRFYHQDWEFDKADEEKLLSMYPVGDGYKNKIKESLQEAYNFIMLHDVNMDFNTRLIKINDKYMKYTTNDTAEYIKYYSEKLQDSVTNKKDRKKEIRKKIKENRNLGNYFENDDLESEMNSLTRTLNSMAPTETERPYARFILNENDLDWFIGDRKLPIVMHGFNLKDHDGIIVINDSNTVKYAEHLLGI